MKTIMTITTLTLCLGLPFVAATKADAAPAAQVTMDQARTTALKARAGTIVSAELEKEKGGSGLRYSFDIKSGSKTFEVGVDAMTGAVLENGTEGAASR